MTQLSLYNTLTRKKEVFTLIRRAFTGLDHVSELKKLPPLLANDNVTKRLYL